MVETIVKEYVIYTVLVGNYEVIHQPVCIDDRFDYVLFSNDFSEPTIGVWQIRPIPQPKEIDGSDNKRLSRYPKTHPETMLHEYEASLYIDANIQIADQWVYDRVVEFAGKKIDYAGVKLRLTGRDCVYRHSFDMCVMGAEHDYCAIRQMHALYKAGFPEHFGLNENNIIFRSHNEQMKLVDELWWDWIVDFSFRDQFSYMYCLWKHRIKMVYFLQEGEDARNSKHFVYTDHNSFFEVSNKKWVKKGEGEKIRNFNRTLTKMHYGIHCRQWVVLAKLPNPVFWLYFMGLTLFCLNVLLYIPIKVKSKIFNFICREPVAK